MNRWAIFCRPAGLVRDGQLNLADLGGRNGGERRTALGMKAPKPSNRGTGVIFCLYFLLVIRSRIWYEAAQIIRAISRAAVMAWPNSIDGCGRATTAAAAPTRQTIQRGPLESLPSRTPHPPPFPRGEGKSSPTHNVVAVADHSVTTAST